MINISVIQFTADFLKILAKQCTKCKTRGPFAAASHDMHLSTFEATLYEHQESVVAQWFSDEGHRIERSYATTLLVSGCFFQQDL